MLRHLESKWIKIISSGNVLEIYRYERMPNPSHRSKSEEIDDDDLDDYPPDRNDKYQSQNDRRSKWNFIRLVNSNFGSHSKFITLTFAENVQDLDQAHGEFKRFIQRMRYRYATNFKYAVAIEFQKRGAVHYHMISDLPYIPKKQLAAIWAQGFVRINDAFNEKDVDNVGAYLSKYMTKGDGRDPRLLGRKMFLTSRGLDRPLVFKGEEADKIIALYNLGQRKVVFESSYPSEHHGVIAYSQYNLKRSVPQIETDYNTGVSSTLATANLKG